MWCQECVSIVGESIKFNGAQVECWKACDYVGCFVERDIEIGVFWSGLSINVEIYIEFC